MFISGDLDNPMRGVLRVGKCSRLYRVQGSSSVRLSCMSGPLDRWSFDFALFHLLLFLFFFPFSCFVFFSSSFKLCFLCESCDEQCAFSYPILTKTSLFFINYHHFAKRDITNFACSRLFGPFGSLIDAVAVSWRLADPLSTKKDKKANERRGRNHGQPNA